MKMRTIRIKGSAKNGYAGRVISIKIRVARTTIPARIFVQTIIEEIPLSKIARRQFIQLSAVAAAGCVLRPGQEAHAQDMPKVEESDAMAQAMKYTHDASTVDASTRANPAPEQTCANCALIQGEDGPEWRPCQIFPGKVVNANGWCSVWAPKA